MSPARHSEPQAGGPGYRNPASRRTSTAGLPVGLFLVRRTGKIAFVSAGPSRRKALRAAGRETRVTETQRTAEPVRRASLSGVRELDFEKLHVSRISRP